MLKIFKECYELREETESLRTSNALLDEDVVKKSFVMTKEEVKEAVKSAKSKLTDK